jgi:TonB family protein
MEPFLSVLAGLAAAAAPPPAPLPAKQAWVINYAETFCSAGKIYGEGTQRVDLYLRPAPGGDVLQFYILRDGRYLPAEHVPVSIGFAGRTIKGTALVYGGKAGAKRAILVNLERDSVGDLPKARTIAFHGADIDYAFAVPDLDKVIAALATCNEDLREHWNMTEAGKAAIKTPGRPITRMRDIISYEDYPSQAVREEDTGTAAVLLLVDETGKVADCLLKKTSGNASLDAMTCIAFIKRARFKPALDAAGKPMKTTFYQSVSWRIQG